MLTSYPPEVILDAVLRALETAGVGCTAVLVRGEELERIYTNDAAAAILGRDVDGMKDVPPMFSLSSEERERLTAMRPRAGDAAAPTRSLRTSIVRPDGVTVPIEVGLATVPLGSVRATFAFLRDLSSTVAMEAALRESEERFRHLAEASPDAITIVRGNRFTYANPTALRHLGLSSLEQLLAIPPMSLTPPSKVAEAGSIAARLAAGESPISYETRAVGPDGREHVFDSSMTQTTLRGEPMVISYTRDVTERVALQAELTKRDRLASVGLLAAGVGHELNNPLAALALQARALLDDADRLGLPDEIRSRLDVMGEAAERMRAIVADLLFMARPVDKPQAHIDVSQVVASSIALMQAGGVRVPVSVELTDLPPISGYASKLGQVFLNVLRNAVEAIGDSPGGAIVVRGRVDGERLHVTVEDTGPGIPPDLLSRIAQPFVTTKPNGVGLGLCISQSLMNDHGGSLDIASTEGQGTTVTLSLPLRS